MKVVVRKPTGTQDPPLVEVVLTMATAEAEACVKEGALSDRCSAAICDALGEHLTAGRRRSSRQVGASLPHE